MLTRNLLVFVTALLIAGQGSALARKKKKHHRPAPAHHAAPAKTQESPEEAQPDSGDEEPPSGAKSAAEPEPERAAPGEATPADEPSADEDARPAPTRRRAPAPAARAEATGHEHRLPPALQAGVRLGGVYRQLSWTQVSSGTLNAFSVSPGFDAGARIEFYPAALVGRDFGSNIGAVAAFDRGFGVTAKGPSGDVDAIFQDYLLGFKVRFPLGLFVPYASLAYGGQAFLFSPRLPAVPSVFYTFVHLGVGARLQLGDAVDLDVGAAYLPVIDAGKQAGYLQSTDYFPTLSSQALEATGSLGVRLVGLLGIRAGVDFRQYALHTANAGTMFAAQSGTDRFLTPWLMIEIVLDGAGPGGGGPED